MMNENFIKDKMDQNTIYSTYSKFIKLTKEIEKQRKIKIKQSTKGKKFISLMELKKDIEKCRNCRLALFRKKVVFGEGNPDAKIIIIHSFPDNDLEAVQSIETYNLLSKMLASISVDIRTVFITNIIKCSPIKQLQKDETNECLKHLFRQIDIIKPKFALILGVFAAQILLKKEQEIKYFQGKLFTIRGLKAIVTYNPEILLTDQSIKQEIWHDLKNFHRLIMT